MLKEEESQCVKGAGITMCSMSRNHSVLNEQESQCVKGAGITVC